MRLQNLFILIVACVIVLLFFTSVRLFKLPIDYQIILPDVIQSSNKSLFIRNGYADGDTYSKYTIDRLGLRPSSTEEINDINHFRYPINDGQERCISGNKTSDVFVLIVSSAMNWKKRNTIRKSWIRQLPIISDDSSTSINYSFFLGLNKNSSSATSTQLQEESKIYRDIVQVSVDDSYYSLTEKSVSLLHWAHNFCHRATFVLKIDDDIYLNAFNLQRVVQDLLSSSSSDNKTIRIGLYGKRNCDECPGGKSRPFRDPS